MKIHLLVVGKPRDPHACALHDRYAERITKFGVGYESAFVAEVATTGKYSDDHLREREARQLLARLDDPGQVVALDPRGRTLTSEELAGRLERWASPKATLVVGGPLGLHRSLLDRADELWSLSSLTLPHELARVVVVEQLYRALTLLRGIP